MKQKSTILLTVTALLLFSCATGRAITRPDDARVCSICPDSFDYIFTSVVCDSGKNPLLSFNHRSKRTFFVRVGDTLGKYTVKSFNPRIERFFNPAINAFQEKDCGIVVLEGPDGETIELEQGKSLPRPGWIAYLVSLDSGTHQYAREGDVAVFDVLRLTVERVTENTVSASIAGRVLSVPLISEEGKRLLADLRTRKLQEREEKQQLALKQYEEEWSKPLVLEVPRPFLPRPLSVSSASKMIIGTEYRYPIAYSAIPAVWDSSGNLIRPAILIPTRFATRLVSMDFPFTCYPSSIGYSSIHRNNFCIQINRTFSF